MKARLQCVQRATNCTTGPTETCTSVQLLERYRFFQNEHEQPTRILKYLALKAPSNLIK